MILRKTQNHFVHFVPLLFILFVDNSFLNTYHKENWRYYLHIIISLYINIYKLPNFFIITINIILFHSTRTMLKFL